MLQPLSFLATSRAALALILVGLLPSPVQAEGGIVSWGNDVFGQVSNTPSETGFTQIAAGERHSLALRGDGSIVSWGRDNFGQVSNTPAGTGFTQVAGGHGHSLALRVDGSIVSWGRDDSGQVSNTPSGTGFTQVAAGAWFSVALRSDGSIVSWGEDFAGAVSNTPSGTGFYQVAAGGRFAVALYGGGQVVSWGSDSNGQVTGTPSDSGFTQVAAGYRHALALRYDGTITQWGLPWGQAPTGTGFTQVAGAYEHSLALRSDGSIVSWGGSDAHGEISNTPSGIGYTQVAGGRDGSLALGNGGSGLTWYWEWSTEAGTFVTDGCLEDGLAPAGTYSILDFTVTSSLFPENVGSMSGGQYAEVGGLGFGGCFYWDGVTDTLWLDSCIGGDVRFARVRGPRVTTGYRFSTGLYAVEGFNGPGSIFSSPVLLLTPVAPQGIPFCLGDGTGGVCPCLAGNAGAGCANTSGVGGATLAASGNALLSADTLQLQIVGVPGDKPGLILRGANQVNGGLGNPAGDGLLCVAGNTARSQAQVTSAGSTTFTDFQGQPFGQTSYGVGATTNYQFWYRDPANQCTGSGFNFSNALAITWLP